MLGDGIFAFFTDSATLFCNGSNLNNGYEQVTFDFYIRISQTTYICLPLCIGRSLSSDTSFPANVEQTSIKKKGYLPG